MKVALWGYYGHNYGDDVMLRVIVDFCIESNIELEIIDMFDGGLSEAYKAEPIKVCNWKESSKIYKMFKLKKLANNQTINLWGGGTIFTDTEGDGNFRVFNLIKKLGGRIGYLGIGIGKLTNKDRIEKTKYLLEKCDLAIFRDENSYKQAINYTNNNNFFLAEDLSYLYFENKKNYQVSSNQNKYILITWRNLKNYMSSNDEHALMNAVVENSIKLGQELGIDKFILAAIDSIHDIESCEDLKNLFESKGKKAIFDKDSSLENITKLIANAGFHFSGRLHGSVASEYFNVPTLSLSYSPKMRYFYESIKRNNFIDVYNEKPNYNDIRKIISNKEITNLDDQFKNAQLNFEYLRNFLKGK